ncbi:hypothetical protein YERSI8AC_310056 [Enterobacterales bacterium 8AC]|nr:hypothetical protein YERSI8AC_310056 [Enterobacterales bacterium 8AC]
MVRPKYRLFFCKQLLMFVLFFDFNCQVNYTEMIEVKITLKVDVNAVGG